MDKIVKKNLIAFFLLTRIGIYIFAIIAFIIFNNNTSSFSEIFTEQWWRWDSVHFVEIANNGYVNQPHSDERFNIVFLPLYPFLINFFSKAGLHPVISGALISNIAALFAVVYLFKLARLDFDEEVSVRSVFYLLIFPTAYFLSAVYTEALFLALSIAAFYYARKNQWLVAGFLGMLAAITRNVGVLLFFALIFEYLYQKNFNYKNIKSDILALGLIPLGFAAYLFLNFYIYGDPFAFMDILKMHWYKYPALPTQGFMTAYNGLFWRQPAESIMVGLMEIIFAFLGLVAIMFSFRIRISYGIYSLLSWILVTSTSFWLSVPRYALSFFPIFILFALWGRKQWFNYTFTFVSLLFFGLFLTIFIIGKWAF